MATNQEILQWLSANPGASDGQIAQAMSQYGVSPQQLAQVTGLDPAAVQNRFDIANNRNFVDSQFGTVLDRNTGLQKQQSAFNNGTLDDSDALRTTGIIGALRARGLNDSQIQAVTGWDANKLNNYSQQYMPNIVSATNTGSVDQATGFYNTGQINTNPVTKDQFEQRSALGQMALNGTSHSPYFTQDAPALTSVTPPAPVSTTYSAPAPAPAIQIQPTLGTTGVPASGQVSNSDITGWLASHPGVTDPQIAQAMSQYGVTPQQMAGAIGADPNYIQQRYDAATTPTIGSGLLGQPAGTTGTPAAPAGMSGSGLLAGNPEGTGGGSMPSGSSLIDPRETSGFGGDGFPMGPAGSTGTPGAVYGGGTARGLSPSATPFPFTGTPGGSSVSPGFGNDYGLSGGGMLPPSVVNQPSGRLDSPSGQMGGIGGGAFGPAGGYGYFGTQSNPHLDQMAGNMQRQTQLGLNDAFNQIRSNSIGTGGLGGTRQGVAQGVAIGRAMDSLQGNLGNLYGGAFEGQQNRGLNQYNTDTNAYLGNQGQMLNYGIGLGGLANQRLGLNQNYDLGRGSQALTNQGQQMNFYTQQRGQDQSGAALGANLYQMGQQGAWGPLNSAAGTYQPFTGFGTTTGGSQQGGGATGAIGGALGWGALGSRLGWWG